VKSYQGFFRTTHLEIREEKCSKPTKDVKMKQKTTVEEGEVGEGARMATNWSEEGGKRENAKKGAAKANRASMHYRDERKKRLADLRMACRNTPFRVLKSGVVQSRVSHAVNAKQKHYIPAISPHKHDLGVLFPTRESNDS
jgi:hypothetical protein